jgi:hypothetical protein
MLANHAGDISAVSVEGTALTRIFLFECKHLAKLDVWQFISGRRSVLGGLWTKAQLQARNHGRIPALIAKRNLGPVLMLVPWPTACNWACCQPSLLARVFWVDVAILNFSELVQQPFNVPPSR